MAFHQKAIRIRPEGHRRGIEKRLAERQPLGILHIGNDNLLRLSPAAGQPGQGKRGRHQLQELPAIHRFIPFRGVAREFAVQQLLEVRIAGKLFQAAPVFLAGAFPEALANRREIERKFP